MNILLIMTKILANVAVGAIRAGTQKRYLQQRECIVIMLSLRSGTTYCLGSRNIAGQTPGNLPGI